MALRGTYLTLHKACVKRESFPADVGVLRCVRPVNLYRRFERSVMSPSAGERSACGMLRLQDENITFLRNVCRLLQHRSKDIISKRRRIVSSVSGLVIGFKGKLIQFLV